MPSTVGCASSHQLKACKKACSPVRDLEFCKQTATGLKLQLFPGAPEGPPILQILNLQVSTIGSLCKPILKKKKFYLSLSLSISVSVSVSLTLSFSVYITHTHTTYWFYFSGKSSLVEYTTLLIHFPMMPAWINPLSDLLSPCQVKVI